MNKLYHTAVGVRDLTGAELKEKRRIMQRIGEVFDTSGYEEIETPTFEYFDVFSREIGTTPSRELFKFFDREGETLVLRPDFTPSVARAALSAYPESTFPVRLWYQGNTFVNSDEYRGRMKEMTQMGVEQIGENSAEADTEVIVLLIRALQMSGLADFQISIGEVGYFRALAKNAGLGEEETEALRQLIKQKNFYGVEDYLRDLPITDAQRDAFSGIPQLLGGEEVLRKAEAYALCPEAEQAIRRLREIYERLEAQGLSNVVSFDFGMLSKFHYYTGILFSAYTYGSGEPVARGGRYDELLAHFGLPQPAVGAMIAIPLLQQALYAGRGGEG